MFEIILYVILFFILLFIINCFVIGTIIDIDMKMHEEDCLNHDYEKCKEAIDKILNKYNPLSYQTWFGWKYIFKNEK